MSSMKVTLLMAFSVAVCPGVVLEAGQGADTAAAHRAVAKNLAKEWPELFDTVCPEPAARGSAPARGAAADQGRAGGAASAARGRGGPRETPSRDSWHREPVKVFDNLYFVGQTEYSAWAVTTSDGIIIIDTIFDYSVEDEVVGGLKTLGLDPAKIKYVDREPRSR